MEATKSLFSKSELSMIATTFAGILTSNAAETAGWQATVNLYHDGKEADKAKKAELSALYKVQYEAKYPGTDSAKVMFSRGCQRAEIQLGYRTMPTPGAKTSGSKKTDSKVETKTETTADVVGAAFTLEIAAMARDIGDSLAHFMTHQRLTKDATEAIGKIAERVNALNVKLGNIEVK